MMHFAWCACYTGDASAMYMYDRCNASMNRADGSVARWNLSNLKSIASLCFLYLLVKFNNACRQVVKQQLPYLMPAQNEWIFPIFCMQQLCLLLSVLHLFNKIAVKIVPRHRLLDWKPTLFESAAL